jgi:hypothetical protein
VVDVLVKPVPVPTFECLVVLLDTADGAVVPNADQDRTAGRVDR